MVAQVEVDYVSIQHLLSVPTSVLVHYTYTSTMATKMTAVQAKLQATTQDFQKLEAGTLIQAAVGERAGVVAYG